MKALALTVAAIAAVVLSGAALVGSPTANAAALAKCCDRCPTCCCECCDDCQCADKACACLNCEEACLCAPGACACACCD